MWFLKIKIKHDCIIGNRTEKFKVRVMSIPFDTYIENSITYAPQLHIIYGKRDEINKFIEDLKEDKRVIYIETEENIVFLIEKRKDKIPSTFYNPKLLHLKPVYVDEFGFEHWELGSWKKEVILDFMKKIEEHFKNYKILKFGEKKINNK